MNKLLRELADGDRGTIRVLLSSCSRGVTAKGAPYLSFTLQDKSGTMDAKYWNVSEEELDRYVPGMIADVSGDVLSHNHQLLKVNIPSSCTPGRTCAVRSRPAPRVPGRLR